MDIPPQQTLYLNNLNDKINKEELRRSLYLLFSQFGSILDVVALKTSKMRGQAFVVFKNIACATTALRAMQDFLFYGKPIRIAYSKTKSIAAMKEDGSYQKFLAKQRRRGKREADADETAAKVAKTEAEMEEEEEEDGEEGGETTTLFVEGLPEDVNEEILKELFGQFKGLADVRSVSGRPDIAFVEFKAQKQGAVAIDALNGFKMDENHAIKVSFAKK
eukprot:m.92005 g.92005  ORF g.92005 m.92005 type:complete len:219 (+) comp12972_c0_seq1:202-858(+)